MYLVVEDLVEIYENSHITDETEGVSIYALRRLNQMENKEDK